MNQQDILQQAMRQIPAALTARGLNPNISEWLVVQRNSRRYLFGVVDVNKAVSDHGSIRAYIDNNLLHDMSTMLKGRPVVISNTTGLRYCIPLTEPPKLPESAPLPETVPMDALPLGVTLQGTIAVHPKLFINALVTGAQGSGKSSFLKALAFTAHRHGWGLYLADAEGHTFNPDAWNSLTLMPVVETAEAFLKLIEKLNAELDRRAEMYRAVASDGLPPANLDDYNREAARLGLAKLPYLLLVSDETNSFFDEKGVAEALAETARRGRKWGLVMLLAAHSWRGKDITRTLSSLFPTRVCFRVADDTTGTVVLESKVWGKKAMAIPLTRQGRGVLMLNGERHLFQSYYLNDEKEREWLRSARDGKRPAPTLTDEEKLALAAAYDNGGKMTEEIMVKAGVPERQAAKIRAEWRKRGWLTPNRMQGNAHCLTASAPSLSVAWPEKVVGTATPTALADCAV